MKNSKLQYWALISEIIGSVAIVISLVYVGFEINQNSKEVRAANRQSIATRVENQTINAALNPEIRFLIDEEYENLTTYRRAQLGQFNAAFFRNTEEAYLMYLEGLLDEEYWQTRSVFFLQSINNLPHVKGYWQTNNNLFAERFRSWVNSEISEPL